MEDQLHRPCRPAKISAFLAIAALASLLLVSLTIAQENTTGNQSGNSSASFGNSTNTTAFPPLNLTQPSAPTNATSPSNETSGGQGGTLNQTSARTNNQTDTRTNPPATPPTPPPESDPGSPAQPATPPIIPIVAYNLGKILPADMRIGDNQLNLLIRNTGNQDITNINALVSGDGVSVYNQEPIDRLAPGDAKWILVWINTKKNGKIPLEIRIQDKTFRANINVVDTEQASQAKRTLEEQAAKNRRVHEIQEDLSNLSDVYESYQNAYVLKQSQNFALENVNLNDAKTYLRNTQSSLAKGDLTDASANLVLLRSELSDVREKLISAQPRARTWKDIAKENVPLISAIIGVLVGGIAVYEKVKPKADEIKKNGLFKKKEDEDGK